MSLQSDVMVFVQAGLAYLAVQLVNWLVFDVLLARRRRYWEE